MAALRELASVVAKRFFDRLRNSAETQNWMGFLKPGPFPIGPAGRLAVDCVEDSGE